jgi:hypothetical protein
VGVSVSVSVAVELVSRGHLRGHVGEHVGVYVGVAVGVDIFVDVGVHGGPGAWAWAVGGSAAVELSSKLTTMPRLLCDGSVTSSHALFLPDAPFLCRAAIDLGTWWLQLLWSARFTSATSVLVIASITPGTCRTKP